MHTHSSLAETITRARLAITGQLSAPLLSQTAPPALHLAEGSSAPPRLTQRPTDPAPARLLPRLASASEVCGAVTLSPGAAVLWRALHDLALHVAAVRGHEAVPSSIVFHLPAVIAAALARYSERHTYRLAAELRSAGLLDSRGYVAQVGKLRRYSGTLYAVALKPDSPAPRLRFWDFRHAHRPGFAEDYFSEKGAWRDVQEALSEPLDHEGKTRALQELAFRYAVETGTAKSPLRDGYVTAPRHALRAVALDLPALIGLHPRQRHREVTRLGAEIAHALSEPSRLRQHCKAIYAALAAEDQLRPGLSALALQLQRLAADLAELAPWAKPGAVLASRLST